MTVAPGAFLAKAKQRMLNKMGKRTTLTRNYRVDFISERLDEIERTRRQVSALMKNYRVNYRATMWAGTELCTELVACWGREMGTRVYVSEEEGYMREKDLEEKGLVEEACVDIRSSMEELEALSTRYDEFLRQETEFPLCNDPGAHQQMLGEVQRSRQAYKEKRTAYSDSMINFRNDLVEEHEVDTIKEEYTHATNDLLHKMESYETLWRQSLCSAVSTFFQVQQRYITSVTQTMSELEIWTAKMSLDKDEMIEIVEEQRAKRKFEREYRFADSKRLFQGGIPAPLLTNVISQRNMGGGSDDGHTDPDTDSSQSPAMFLSRSSETFSSQGQRKPDTIRVSNRRGHSPGNWALHDVDPNLGQEDGSSDEDHVMVMMKIENDEFEEDDNLR